MWVVGHRGAAAKAPENTASSLRAGLLAGADAIEFDVGRSRDGRAVLLHDTRLNRTTDGRGMLAERTWEELSALDAGSWFSGRFAGERLLDLDGALAIVRSHVPVVVELKARAEDADPVARPDDVDLAHAVLGTLERTGGFDNVTVSSSNWALLEAISVRRLVGIALTYRSADRRDPVAVAHRIGAAALHANKSHCDRTFVATARSAGLAVYAYTVNRARDLDAALDAGVTGVFSDDPATIARLLARRRPAPGPRGPLTLGIDQGSGGTRAVLLTERDEVLLSHEVRVASRRTASGRVLQDPAAIAASVVRAAAPLLAKAPLPVRSAGIATQRASLVLWRRRDGWPAGPVLSWRSAGPGSTRSDLLAREDEIVQRTGMTPRFPYGAIRLAETARQDPDTARALGQGEVVAGSVGAFLAARLAGTDGGGSDPSLAQRMMLLDLHRLAWDESLASVVGVETAALPSLLPTTADRGTLRIGEYRPSLRALVGDASAAFRAVAGPSGKGGVIVLGTGGFVLVGTGAKPVRVPGLLTSILWEDAKGPRYAVEGTVHGVLASLLEIRARAGLGSLAPDLVAATSGTASRYPAVDASIEGSGTPDWDLEPRFTVEEGDWTAAELVRGTIEALAERFGRIGDLLREAGVLPDRFTATGGLAFSPHLVTAISRRMGAPVRVDPRPHLTAVGAAMLAR